MKLPRYLQVALVLTAGLALWSQFSSDETQETVHLRAPTTRPAPAVKPSAEPLTTVRRDLFPPHNEHEESPETVAVEVAPPPPSAPPLPLQVLGAWWEQRQRIIILTDGQETWPVCERCRADGKIWLGDSPVSGWTLTEVANDYLQFEWTATHMHQRLSLEELTSEPQ